MKRFSLAAALIASTLIAAPVGSALASGGWEHGQAPGWHHENAPQGKFGQHHGEFAKWGRHHFPKRTRPVTAEEARTLIEAMLLRRGTTDITIGGLTTKDDGAAFSATLTNAKGDVITDLDINAQTGWLKRHSFAELRRVLPRDHDMKSRLERRYSDQEMSILANAMAIRFGAGELKLASLEQTKRGTYMATLANQAGDIVREWELSRVTGRPIR